MCSSSAEHSGHCTIAGRMPVGRSIPSDRNRVCRGSPAMEGVFMSEVLDQSQDVSGSELHRLTTIYTPPDFVKVASAERLFGDPDSQPRHSYADQLHKR